MVILIYTYIIRNTRGWDHYAFTIAMYSRLGIFDLIRLR